MNRLTHHLGLKLISLALAILLWSHVRGEVNPLETMTVDVPLRASAPKGWIINNQVPAKVTVLLQGPRLSLRNIKGGALASPVAPGGEATSIVKGTVRAEFDWSRPRTGEQKVGISAQSAVADVEVLSVTPAEISIDLEAA
jgi:hypothetical protein